MTHDEGKEDKFDFTDEGEAKYIGLDEARILAIQAANETPGDYGRRYSNSRMVFEPQDDEETEEYYRIVLSIRPQGEFSGAPGREEFYVEKLTQAEGTIAHRQVLAAPIPKRRRRPVWILVSVAVLVLVIASGAVGGLYLAGILPPSESVEDSAVKVSESPLQTPAPAVAPSIAPEDDPVEVIVSPQSPSLLVSSDNTVIVNVPVGSVTALATLRYESVNPQLVPRLAAGYSRVVKAFSLDLTTTQQPGVVHQLEKPITVTLTLTDADIQLAGGDGTNLVIQHFKLGQQTGEPLETTFDSQNRTVSAEVASLSIFALTVRSEGAPQALVTPTPDNASASTPPTVTPTSVLTDEPPTRTPNPAFLGSRTPTPTPKPSTSSPVPERKLTTTFSLIPTATLTLVPIPTLQVVATRKLTPTPLPSPTLTPRSTPTVVLTRMPTRTPSPTPIPPTFTPSPTRTPLPPNLVPFQPEGWNAPLVISDVKSPFLDIPPPGGTEFILESEVFVHWAIKNESGQSLTQPFQVGIAIDGVIKVTFVVERMDSNEIVRMVNVELSIDSPGTHRFELIVDVDNRVSERDERDNVYIVNPRWVTPTPTPTPTATATATPVPTGADPTLAKLGVSYTGVDFVAELELVEVALDSNSATGGAGVTHTGADFVSGLDLVEATLDSDNATLNGSGIRHEGADTAIVLPFSDGKLSSGLTDVGGTQLIHNGGDTVIPVSLTTP